MNGTIAVNHILLLEDRKRTAAYREAILEVIKKGDVVADIGTGTGILAFFACQAGAKKCMPLSRGK